jgi:hypothetical protein
MVARRRLTTSTTTPVAPPATGRPPVRSGNLPDVAKTGDEPGPLEESHGSGLVSVDHDGVVRLSLDEKADDAIVASGRMAMGALVAVDREHVNRPLVGVQWGTFSGRWHGCSSWFDWLRLDVIMVTQGCDIRHPPDILDTAIGARRSRRQCSAHG